MKCRKCSISVRTLAALVSEEQQPASWDVRPLPCRWIPRPLKSCSVDFPWILIFRGHKSYLIPTEHWTRHKDRYVRTAVHVYHDVCAFTCKFMLQISSSFNREFSNLSTLFFCSIPIGIYLLELKMKGRYARQYFFRKNNEKYDLPSDEISHRVNDISFLNAMGITAEK